MGEKNRCPNYCGIVCVNGSCPNALANDYTEYGYEHCTCEDCGHYKGCEDCCFLDNDGNCVIDVENCGGGVLNGSVNGF